MVLLLQSIDFFWTVGGLQQNTRLHRNSLDTYKGRQKQNEWLQPWLLTNITKAVCWFSKKRSSTMNKWGTKSYRKSVPSVQTVTLPSLIFATWVRPRLSASFWAAPGIALLGPHESLEFASSSSETDNEGLCRPCLKIITIWDTGNQIKNMFNKASKIKKIIGVYNVPADFSGDKTFNLKRDTFKKQQRLFLKPQQSS